MNTVRLNAYAKLNLTLDITGREGGYHTLDSLAVTVDLSDRVVVTRRKDGAVRVVMHGMGSESIPPEENNALRAGELFCETFGASGADVTVYKNIPIGAGMGGSSADAAAVVKGMGMLYGVHDEGALKAVCDRLGSDTGYLLTGGFSRLGGRGERVERLPFPAPAYFLCILPQRGVSSAACYAAYDARGSVGSPRTERALEAVRAGGIEAAARLFGNDLAEAAESLEADVGTALREARSFSPLGAGVTGSGSGVFACFGSRELCEWARSRYRGRFRTAVVRSKDPSAGAKSPFALGEDEIR